MSAAPAPSPAAPAVPPVTAVPPAAREPEGTSPSDRERERGDAECLAFFLALVTAALVMAGLALATDLEPLLRVLLSLGASGLAGALTLAFTRPSLED